jgi:L-alanine-DL-glutamate epimerase-like enolase superfamily enzyme
MSHDKDIRVERVRFGFEEFSYRTKIKFGGNVVSQMTLLNVQVEISDRKGRKATGRGSMPLGNVWSFPSKVYSYDDTLGIMKRMATLFGTLTAEYREFGHPVEINYLLEPEYAKATLKLEKEMSLSERIPKLCTLVTASPFDAAIHDAYGRLHGINVYHAYSESFMNYDLSFYLGPAFAGHFLDRFTLRNPKAKTPLYHLVGALDPLTDQDGEASIHDGLPVTLSDWIRQEGLTHFKIKLNGDDFAWDSNRMVSVDKVCSQEIRGRREWVYSADFNERCPHADYLVEILKKFAEETPAGFSRLQYVEQPTSRYLKEVPEQNMTLASSLKPVVIDESLTDLESLNMAIKLGYSGVALKACKGQSQSLLMAAAAQAKNLFLCVQDLTCPGASFLHSAGLSARVPGVVAIEGNARQYCPEANRGWEKKYPGLFVIRDGTVETGVLTGPGLGFDYPD